MPINSMYQAELECQKFYHIFNRSHSDLQLFYKPFHFFRFLNRTEKYLADYVDFLAYSLIPTHFHFLVRVKQIEENIYSEKHPTVDEFLTRQLNNLFISHTKYVNKSEDRHGGLFCTPFRCKLVQDAEYFEQLFYYIHWNHVHHGISKKIEDYSYSSYNDYRLNQQSFINRQLGFEWFGGRESFFRKHLEQSCYINKAKFEFE